MRYVIYVLLTGIVLTLQLTLAKILAIQSITPDLLLLLVVIIALREGKVTGILAGFFIGLLDDMTMTGLLGLSALCMALAGFVAGTFYGVKAGLNKGILLVILLISALVHECVSGFITSFAPEQNFFLILMRYSLPTMLYTTGIGFIIFALLPQKVWKMSVPEWFMEAD